jgi:sigma-B regulation protein RsbU (phosphoserine phosphatase)
MRDVRDIVTGAVRDILDSLNAGVYLTDRDRRIVFWNKRAAEITGYQPGDVTGTACHDGILEHVDKDGRPLCSTDLCPLHRSMVTDRSSPAPVLVYAKSASGDRVPVSTATAPVHDEEGNVIGGVEVLQDERGRLKEMELARATQLQVIQRELPQDDRVSFGVHWTPTEMVGGDYYRVERLSDSAFGVFVADVAGHGVPAALFVALVHYLAQENADRMARPAEFLAALNASVCARVPDLGFVTGLCAELDVEARVLRYCSAGHPPALRQTDGGQSVALIGNHNLPLGVHASSEYDEVKLSLASGDRILAYTDGATETRTGGGLLGTGGLIDLARRFPPLGTDHRLQSVYQEIVAACVTHMPEDDITLVSCIVA